MADLFTSEGLLSALPQVLKESNSTNALGKAIAKALAETKEEIALLRLYGSIDTLPERILDILAAELRTQYYETSLPIETKRTLIRNTLLWYKKAGTLSALKELVESLYGTCEISEWWEYDGEPGHFRLESADVITVLNNVDAFLDALQRVKRLSAHLDEIAVIPEYEIQTIVGLALQSYSKVTMVMAPFSIEDFASFYVNGDGAIYTDSHGNIFVRG